ncbi:MAG: A/G-specific adenine glycosylase [Bacteroidales bacterium]|nr:A/G-specific adenine glycosylase [Bacteroidales bacterium]MDY0215333.1 A/G-specific adenine glycosylase [Bacteroidales bacterium]
MNFSSELLNWYAENKRDLPWRNTRNPYLIWVSEIIMQQTRVEQGLPYYQRFISSFPNLKSLANAPLDSVLHLWQGLGYYSRARNMHQAAKQILEDFNGEFPSTFAEILKLKGVGKYTASAIASFAFGEYTPVVDGNVIRVTSRYLGIYDEVSKKENVRKIEYFVLQEIQKVKTPDIFNQAIMEYGALYCTPQNPNCQNCLFNMNCRAFADDKVNSTPLVKKPAKKQKRFLNYVYFKFLNKGVPSTLVFKRVQKDIWQDLYELPLMEQENAKKIDIVDFFHLPKSSGKILKKHSKIIHQLSHRELHIVFWECDVSLNAISDTLLTLYELIPQINLSQKAFPVPIVNFINQKEETEKRLTLDKND